MPSYRQTLRTFQVVLLIKTTDKDYSNAGDGKRCRLDPWFRKIPWRRKWQPTLVFLPGKCHGQRTWWATAHKVAQSQTQLKQQHAQRH